MSANTIELLIVEEKHKVALQSGKQDLSALLGVSVPDAWPQFPEAFVPSASVVGTDSKWPAYFFIDCEQGSLVGNGGYFGAPNEAGEVEIGYEIAPEFRERGFATAAARALVDFAFSQPEVTVVMAHTLAETNASNAVLKKLGMVFVAEQPNPEVGMVWEWRLSR